MKEECLQRLRGMGQHGPFQKLQSLYTLSSEARVKVLTGNRVEKDIFVTISL